MGAMVVGAVVIAIMFAVYNVQQRSFRRETMVVDTQQNVRTAFILVEKDMRMIGYDRLNTDLFGITNIGFNAPGQDTLTFTADMGIGTADNGLLDTASETFTYALYDAPNTPAVGILDLGLALDTAAPDLVAAGIEALGFAYAFDVDADGRLDFNDDGDGIMTPPNENIYWAADSDNDNFLDIELDTDKDGDIDTADGTANLPSLVPVDRIRAIKVFILARSKGMDLSYTNNETYRVGQWSVSGNGDQFRRRLLVTTVKCRNLGL
jgi:type IV pilus assembly protein PilW